MEKVTLLELHVDRPSIGVPGVGSRGARTTADERADEAESSGSVRRGLAVAALGVALAAAAALAVRRLQGDGGKQTTLDEIGEPVDVELGSDPDEED